MVTQMMDPLREPVCHITGVPLGLRREPNKRDEAERPEKTNLLPPGAPPHTLPPSESLFEQPLATAKR